MVLSYTPVSLSSSSSLRNKPLRFLAWTTVLSCSIFFEGLAADKINVPFDKYLLNRLSVKVDSFPEAQGSKNAADIKHIPIMQSVKQGGDVRKAMFENVYRSFLSLGGHTWGNTVHKMLKERGEDRSYGAHKKWFDVVNDVLHFDDTTFNEMTSKTQVDWLSTAEKCQSFSFFIDSSKRGDHSCTPDQQDAIFRHSIDALREDDAYRYIDMDFPGIAHYVLGSFNYVPDSVASNTVDFGFYDSGGFVSAISREEAEKYGGKSTSEGGKSITRWTWRCDKEALLKVLRELAVHVSMLSPDMFDDDAKATDVDKKKVDEGITKTFKELREKINGVCTETTFLKNKLYDWQTQQDQKVGNCQYEAFSAANHANLHPVVYRLERISIFIDAALFYYKLYQEEEKCFAGKRYKDLSSSDLTLLNASDGEEITTDLRTQVLDEAIKLSQGRAFRRGELAHSGIKPATGVEKLAIGIVDGIDPVTKQYRVFVPNELDTTLVRGGDAATRQKAFADRPAIGSPGHQAAGMYVVVTGKGKILGRDDMDWNDMLDSLPGNAEVNYVIDSRTSTRRMYDLIDFNGESCQTSWLLMGESFGRILSHAKKMSNEWCGAEGAKRLAEVRQFEKDTGRKMVQYQHTFEDLQKAQQVLALFADHSGIMDKTELVGQIKALQYQFQTLHDSKNTSSWDLDQFLKGFCALKKEEKHLVDPHVPNNRKNNWEKKDKDNEDHDGDKEEDNALCIMVILGALVLLTAGGVVFYILFFRNSAEKERGGEQFKRKIIVVKTAPRRPENSPYYGTEGSSGDEDIVTQV